jgi:hypothetical protein
MLNLAIIALVILVASALWLLLLPPAPIAAEQTGPDDTDPIDDDELTAPLGHPDVHVIAPSQSGERAPNH